MSYSFEQYTNLVERVGKLDNTRGGTEHVYVPGTGEISDARHISGLESSADVAHEAFVMFHRLAAAQAVDLFDGLINSFADGDPVGAVRGLFEGLGQLRADVSDWYNFTNEHSDVLSPGGY